MTYVIAEPCIDLKDKACIEECPVDCIYEGGRMLYIHPDECVDCGACEPVCPVEAIYYEDDLPKKSSAYSTANADFFGGLGSPGAHSLEPIAYPCCDRPTEWRYKMADQASVRKLFQSGYYDNIDGQDIENAVLTMHPDVEFIHTQVWQGGDLRLGSNHWHGRAQVQAFLTEAAPRLKDAQIRHKVDTVVVDGDRGALQCHVENRDGADVKAPFLVWFELKDDMISRYIVCPYDGS